MLFPINNSLGLFEGRCHDQIAIDTPSAQNPHLFQRNVEKMVATVLDEIAVALAHGDRVELRGFGTFAVKVREGRVGRNPKTGAPISIPETRHPSFRTGKEREALPALHFTNRSDHRNSSTEIPQHRLSSICLLSRR